MITPTVTFAGSYVHRCNVQKRKGSEIMQIRTIPMEALSELVLLQLENGGKARLTVTGCSMQPMLYHRRDAVELKPVESRQRPGDVILYRRENGQFVLHRIIGETPEGYICCGDNQYMREQVAHTQLLAVVEGFTRKGKRYTTEALGYRLYTWVWVKLFFLRKYYIPIRRYLGRIRSKLRRRTLKNGG